MDKKYYIGNNEVVVSNEDSVTGIVKYVLDSNEAGEVTAEQFKAMALPEPYEERLISVKKWSPVVSQILGILKDANLRLMDKDFVLNQIDSSINAHYEDAAAKLFGVSHPLKISYKQIDDVLKINATTMSEETTTEEAAAETPASEETPAE